MIAKLKGLVDTLGEDFVILDVNGVGYLVFCSSKTLARLPGAGEACALVIETHVREDHIHLYGFVDQGELDWFKLVTTVQGVGAKMGLAILSALSPDELIQAIAAQDTASLRRANGVGPKVATRILTELKDKAGTMALGSVAQQTPEKNDGGKAVSGNAVAETASALVNLGYGRSEALSAASRAVQKSAEGASLDQLIPLALAELSTLVDSK